MSRRVEENRAFLEQLSKSTSYQRKHILERASDEEIKSIVELILNLEEKAIKKDKSLKSHFKVIKKLKLADWKNLDTAVVRLIANEKTLRVILCYSLVKVLEYIISCVVNS